MSDKQAKPAGSPVERIMTVATQLFYMQGYRATGINEVIQKSGVAKATFYKHFPAKDDLGRAYLQAMREGQRAYLDDEVGKKNTPEERWLVVVDSLIPWLVETNFRGCAFMNIASEVTDSSSPMRREGVLAYDMTLALLRALSTELVESDQQKYGHLDAEQLTADYMLIFAGAVAMAELYNAEWPVVHAQKTIRGLLG